MLLNCKKKKSLMNKKNKLNFLINQKFKIRVNQNNNSIKKIKS